jgi:hypothetical protein
MRFLVLVVGLLVAGCAVPLRVDGRWTELRSAHFRVLTDVEPAPVAREVPRIETVLAGIAVRVRPDRPLPPLVEVLWLRRADALETLGVAHARGYYLPHQGDEPTTPPLVVVAGEPSRDVEQALVHELAHVVFVDAAPDAPAWLAEGVAAWWDTLDVDGRNVGFDDDSHAEQSTGVATGTGTRRIHLISVDPLLHASFDWFHATGFGAYVYASARAFIAMLESEPDLRPRLDAYIARLGDGAGSDRAWQDSFAAVGVHALQARFDRFFVTRRQSVTLTPWTGTIATRAEMPPAVERWFARARPWDSRGALAEAGRALARAAADDSAERHYWSGVLASAEARWPDAVIELRAALARDPTMTRASSALARVEARLRARP